MYDVRRVRDDEADSVVAVLAEAFMHDPVSRWIFPNEDDRRRLHDPFFRIFVEMVLAEGAIHTTRDFAGVALWLDVDPTTAQAEEDLGGVFTTAIGPDAGGRFAILDKMMTEGHPHHAAHAYLPFVGVDPRWHGRGVGTALLQARLGELDAAGTPAYLEASNLPRQTLYERLGFKPYAGRLDLPGNGAFLQPMWREADAS